MGSKKSVNPRWTAPQGAGLLDTSASMRAIKLTQTMAQSVWWNDSPLITVDPMGRVWWYDRKVANKWILCPAVVDQSGQFVSATDAPISCAWDALIDGGEDRGVPGVTFVKIAEANNLPLIDDRCPEGMLRFASSGGDRVRLYVPATDKFTEAAEVTANSAVDAEQLDRHTQLMDSATQTLNESAAKIEALEAQVKQLINSLAEEQEKNVTLKGIIAHMPEAARREALGKIAIWIGLKP